MTRTLPLPDGTRLDLTGDDPFVGIDSLTSRTVRWDAAQSALKDSEGNVIRPVATGPQIANAEVRRTKQKAPTGDGSRFATMNTFVDQVMRHLSPVESAVWLALFRDCRHGQASASNRDLARRTGCSVRAVTDAMQRLRCVRLIDGLRLSTRKGQPSLYAINPKPESCVPALEKQPKRKPRRPGARHAPDGDESASDQMHAMHRMEE
jgi:hypothetical protein